MIGLNMIVEYSWFEDCIQDDVDEERKKGGSMLIIYPVGKGVLREFAEHAFQK
jgi:hypothetical protein